jgi:hypothetical protein
MNSNKSNCVDSINIDMSINKIQNSSFVRNVQYFEEEDKNKRRRWNKLKKEKHKFKEFTLQTRYGLFFLASFSTPLCGSS